jgi:acyl carrier protein
MSDLSETAFLEVVRRYLRFLPADQPLDWDRPLRELGLNSMSSINLLLDVEVELGVTFTPELLSPESFSTARALWSATQVAAGAGA